MFQLFLNKGLGYTQTGTPFYASPEIWRDQPYDYKSDIWSLGCVFYESVGLRPPFRASNMEGLYKKVVTGLYPNLSSRFSKELSQIIKAMIQVNPKRRPSAEKLLN
jgi:serine/threonine protein kinase